MAQALYPKANAYFLAESGLLRPDGRPASGKLGAKERVLLSRALVRYQFAPRGKGLSNAQADKAVLLMAESRAPFPDSDFLIQRGVHGYGVWWWDASRVRDLLAESGGYDKTRLVPESLLFGVGHGWRQSVTAEGYEAQCWRDLTLIASTWRRRPFTHEQWLAFVESAGEAGADAPMDAPEPTTPPISGKNIQKIAAVQPRQLMPQIEGAALSLAAASACAALFFAAQGASYSVQLKDEQAALASLKQANAGKTGQGGASLELEALQTLADDWRRPNPLVVGASAFKVLKSFGETPVRWSVQEGKLRLETPLSADTSIEEVAGFLERDKWLSNVDPRRDPASGNAMFVADVCPVMGRDGCGGGESAPTQAGPAR